MTIDEARRRAQELNAYLDALAVKMQDAMTDATIEGLRRTRRQVEEELQQLRETYDLE